MAIRYTIGTLVLYFIKCFYLLFLYILISIRLYMSFDYINILYKLWYISWCFIKSLLIFQLLFKTNNLLSKHRFILFIETAFEFIIIFIHWFEYNLRNLSFISFVFHLQYFKNTRANFVLSNGIVSFHDKIYIVISA